MNITPEMLAKFHFVCANHYRKAYGYLPLTREEYDAAAQSQHDAAVDAAAHYGCCSHCTGLRCYGHGEYCSCQNLIREAE